MGQPLMTATRPIGRNSTSGGVSLRGILHVLFRWKWLILLVFMLIAPLASVAVLHLSKTRYEAVAQMLVSPGAVELPTDSGAPISSIGPDERMARASHLLTGRSLAEQVVDAIGPELLYPDLAARDLDPKTADMVAVARLMKNLSVDANGRASIITLGFNHENPVMAARIPNLLGELYVDRYLRVEQNPQADAFFEEQLAARRQKLTESEQALESFRSRHRISGSLTEERKLASTELAALRSSLAETNTRQAELKSQFDAIGRKMLIDARIPRSYYQIKERLATLEAEASELAISVTPQHPRLRELREQMRGLREKLKSDGVDSSYGSAKEQEEFNVNLQIELARVRGELGATEVRQAALSTRIEEARKRVESLDYVDSEFNQLQTQLKADEESHRLLLSKVQNVRMANMRDAERLVGIKIIEEARTPSLPVDSRTGIKLLVSILASAFAAVGSAFLLQFARARLETGEDIERVLGLRVLGSITELGSK